MACWIACAASEGAAVVYPLGLETIALEVLDFCDQGGGGVAAGGAAVDREGGGVVGGDVDDFCGCNSFFFFVFKDDC